MPSGCYPALTPVLDSEPRPEDGEIGPGPSSPTEGMHAGPRACSTPTASWSSRCRRVASGLGWVRQEAQVRGGGNMRKAGGRAGGRAGWPCWLHSLLTLQSSRAFLLCQHLCQQSLGPPPPRPPSTLSTRTLYLLKHCKQGGESAHSVKS